MFSLCWLFQTIQRCICVHSPSSESVLSVLSIQANPSLRTHNWPFLLNVTIRGVSLCNSGDRLEDSLPWRHNHWVLFALGTSRACQITALKEDSVGPCTEDRSVLIRCAPLQNLPPFSAPLLDECRWIGLIKHVCGGVCAKVLGLIHPPPLWLSPSPRPHRSATRIPERRQQAARHLRLLRRDGCGGLWKTLILPRPQITTKLYSSWLVGEKKKKKN